MSVSAAGVISDSHLLLVIIAFWSLLLTRSTFLGLTILCHGRTWERDYLLVMMTRTIWRVSIMGQTMTTKREETLNFSSDLLASFVRFQSINLYASYLLCFQVCLQALSERLSILISSSDSTSLVIAPL